MLKLELSPHGSSLRSNAYQRGCILLARVHTDLWKGMEFVERRSFGAIARDSARRGPKGLKENPGIFAKDFT